jgi:hypothetical protein
MQFIQMLQILIVTIYIFTQLVHLLVKKYGKHVIPQMLIDKNIAYGDSALDPVRIFSKSDAVEQLRVRIDDKLSRLMKGTDYIGDNDIDDLIGYLVLLKIAKEKDVN